MNVCPSADDVDDGCVSAQITYAYVAISAIRYPLFVGQASAQLPSAGMSHKYIEGFRKR